MDLNAIKSPSTFSRSLAGPFFSKVCLPMLLALVPRYFQAQPSPFVMSLN